MFNRHALLLTLAVAGLMASGCAHRLTDFTVIANQSTSLAHEAEADSEPVQGEHCVLDFWIFRGAKPNLKSAIDNAIENAGPDYDALRDVTVYTETRAIYSCFTVEGTPLRSGGGR